MATEHDTPQLSLIQRSSSQRAAKQCLAPFPFSTDVFAMLDELAGAAGIVVDMRGYPAGSHYIFLQYMSDSRLSSPLWNVPQIIYPDQKRIAGWFTSNSSFEPRQPLFGGRIVFLTDARAISYAESVMGLVEHHQLGDIVGRPTAGANGHVNVVNLSGGYRVSFTGMKVLKQDGSQHHLIGIVPTVQIDRTIASIREGRDEDLEAALALITGR